MTKKQRQKLRSKYLLFRDMHPHIFNKLISMNPYVLTGINIPKHYG